MANIELVRSDIDLIIAPFPGVEATFSASTEWRPSDRADVGNQHALLTDTINASHSVPAVITSAVNIQTAATAFLESQFGARGQSLVSSPVSAFTISWAFDHPAALSSVGVSLRLTGVWKPAEYDHVQPQTEVILQDLPGNHSLIADFQVLSDHVLTIAQAEYPQHTVVEPVAV